MTLCGGWGGLGLDLGLGCDNRGWILEACAWRLEVIGGYDQLCCPASPKLLLGLDLGLGCDNRRGLILCKIHVNF